MRSSLMKLTNPTKQPYGGSFFSCPSCSFQSFRTITSLNNPIKMHTFQNFEQNNNSINHLSRILDECTYSRDIRAAFSVHNHIMKLYSIGFPSLWNKLLNLYCKCRQFHVAWKLFEIMPERNVVSFNTMILTCVRSGYGLEAIFLYCKMIREENVKPNHITLAGLIGACDGALGGMQFREVLHGQAIQHGLNSNEFVGSSLIDGYAEENKLEDAIKVFHEIAELDLVSWNIMIDGCVQNTNKVHAWGLFRKMLQENVAYDGFTLTSIVKTCSNVRDLDRGRLIQGCAIKIGLASETPISNALITMYSKCEERMASAIKVFARILARNIISWTAMIAGFMQNGQDSEAINLYRAMVRLDIKENDFTFASILSAYSNLANLEEGRQIHARIVKSWFGFDLSVNNALINLYSKCGSLDEAHLVFRTMGTHDKISFTTIITGLGQHGKGNEALKVLEEMVNDGINPDEITFLGCLCACSHGGHVNTGINVFKVMIDVYNLKPRREHFSCVVDMLGRAGRLKEAELFIEELGIGSDVFIWEALLGACKLHGEISLGEKSVKKIMELDPGRHGPYVLLGNIYAEKELWEDKGEVRENLIMNVSRKETGSSRLS